MSKTEDQQVADMVRTFENRIVWLAAFLVSRATSLALSDKCGKAADEALDEYQQRFPPIQPPE